MERKITFAQYGCGKMGKYLIRYGIEKGAELVAAFDVNPAILGKDAAEIAGDGYPATGIQIADASQADEILGNGGHIMNLFAEGGPWLTILFFSVLFLVIFRRPLGWLLKLLARSALGLGFLALWSQSGLAAGLALGVNAFNALTLGLLGLPGLGLLFLFRWVGT